MVDKRVYAVWAVAFGAGIGIVGNAFFMDRPPGLTLPLFALIVAGVVLGTAAMMGRSLRPRNLWPLIPLLFFAAMGAVRADPLIIFLDIVAIFGLGALVLYYLPQSHALDEDTLGEYAQATAEASLHVVAAPGGQIIGSLGWLRDKRPLRRPVVGGIARGLLLAAPLLVIFAVLFASADAVFAGYISRAWKLFQFPDMFGLAQQGIVIVALGWLGCGAIAYGARTLKPAPAAGADEARPAKKRVFTLGVVEAFVVLGAVDALFATFVAIQFRYFFGGKQNVAVEALTYAQYARRGFFELVAVSVLTLGVVLWLDWVTVRHTRRQQTVFRALAVVMVALTGVLLVSAAQRMTLYEQTFGFTHLRVYTHVFIFWLAALFVFFLMALFRLRDRIFSLGTLLVIVGYLATLNVMNTEQVIAGENVARHLSNPSGVAIDICYLRTLSTDALPAMLTLYHDGPDADVRAQAGEWLRYELDALDRIAESETLLTFNLSRSNARAALEPLRATLDKAYLREDACYGTWMD